MADRLNIYVSNKMSYVPFFNAPWFDRSAAAVGQVPWTGDVFNPAQHDREMGFDPMLCPNGTPEEARTAGFPANAALRADWIWIADISNGCVVGPQWPTSPGAISEIACHQALRKPVWEYEVFMDNWHRPMDYLYTLVLPPLLELGGLMYHRQAAPVDLVGDGLTCDH
jgi:hypothetical protein